MARFKTSGSVGVSSSKKKGREVITKTKEPQKVVEKKEGPVASRKKRQNQILKMARRQRRGGFAIPHTVYSRMIQSSGGQAVQLHARVRRDLHEMTEEWMKDLFRVAYSNATTVGHRCRITGIEVDHAITTRMAGHPTFLRFYEQYVKESVQPETVSP